MTEHSRKRHRWQHIKTVRDAVAALTAADPISGWMRAEDAARYASIERHTLRDLADKHGVRGVLLGNKQVLYRRHEIDLILVLEDRFQRQAQVPRATPPADPGHGSPELPGLMSSDSMEGRGRG